MYFKNKKISTTEKRAQALALRTAGLSYKQIGEQLGVSRQMAHKYVAKELESLAEETKNSATKLREMELLRLDKLLTGIWGKATKGELAALDRALRIIESRSKLLGIVAPTKVAPTNPDGTEAYSDPIIAMSVEERRKRIAELEKKLSSK